MASIPLQRDFKSAGKPGQAAERYYPLDESN
jgi:hypothetical protein